jgi:small-conductance mechanosensitive channel
LLHFHIPVFGASHAPATLTDACGPSPGIACRLVWDLSHNGRAAELTNSFLAGPVHLLLRLAFVVLLALLIRFLVHRVINRLTERAAYSFLPQLRSASGTSPFAPGQLARHPVRYVRQRRSRGAAAEQPHAADATAEATLAAARPAPADQPLAPEQTQAAEALSAAEAVSAAERAPAAEDLSTARAAADATVASAATAAEQAADMEHALVDERRHQRVRALGSILRSAASIAIFGIAGVVILGDLGINLAPLLASAGVVGIAIGFGAQNLVRDYLSGIFMLLEDQYGVGDSITVGDASGTVETVTLRITRMRDTKGVVWHIRNGAIEQVGNESQGWARAVIDYPVPYNGDLDAIRDILDTTAQALWHEPEWRAVMLAAPEVWGAQAVSSKEVTMRIVVKTAPLRQWSVEREMRARVKAALDDAGVRFPPPSADN